MTQDEIIRFAIQCYIVTTPSDRINMDVMTKFAALVAAKEREACARVVEDSLWFTRLVVAKAIRARGQA